MGKKILLIVEGENDEVLFFNYLFKKCQKTIDYSIYSYKTNIHILAEELKKNYNDFNYGDIDIKLVLSSIEKDRNEKKKLNDTYTDIYMVFDFEPQHNRPHFDIIKKMLDYFNDSTDQGKLYINYPMMQSYKHLKTLPDDDYEYLEVNIEDVKRYKMIVNDVSCIKDLKQYSHITFYSIAVHNLKKVNKICNNKYLNMNEDDYLKLKSSDIYNNEYQLLKDKEKISVLNTSIFVLIDYAPKRFFKYITSHGNNLLI